MEIKLHFWVKIRVAWTTDEFIFILFGVHDPIKAPYTNPGATFLNNSWGAAFERLNISPEHLWSRSDTRKSLWTARLFAPGDAAAAAAIRQRLAPLPALVLGPRSRPLIHDPLSVVPWLGLKKGHASLTWSESCQPPREPFDGPLLEPT